MTEKQHPALSGIERAVQKVGSQAALAELLKSRFPHKKHPSQQAISQWVQQGHVPAARAREVAAIAKVPVLTLLSPELRSIVAR